MKTRFYKATSGYHDLTPGMGKFEFVVKTTDKGVVVSQPKGTYIPEFNEVQIEGDPNLRREFLPQGTDPNKILFIDDPNYDALKIRSSTLATKQIPLDHSDCFVSRWLCLSNSPEEVIEKGVKSPLGCYNTKAGAWGGLGTLKLKKEMLPYIKELGPTTYKQLQSAASSATFARKFVNWRDTLEKRITYQPVEDK